MKGISHFAVGVAVASCFPGAIEAGATGNPLYFVLGGFAGLLPDTFDFRFTRFLYRHDIEVVPDPNQPAPQMIADAVALAINRAHEQQRPVRIKLGAIRLGSHRWQQYRVAFDVQNQSVRVTYGPVMDGGPTRTAGLYPTYQQISSPLTCGIKLDYEYETSIDILDGPVFEMAPTNDGRVLARFIPWHRQWSHSLTIALVMGLTGAAFIDLMAGVTVFLAYAAHIIVDQTGYLGCNLFFPFTRTRRAGLRLLRSVSPICNLAAVWAACVLTFLNLANYSKAKIPQLTFIQVTLFAFALPVTCLCLAGKLLKPHPTRQIAPPSETS